MCLRPTRPTRPATDTRSRQAPSGPARASKAGADVWKRGHFGWEYKGAHADLAAAYRQLLDYREALENPPLLVVSDMERVEVHTNFTNTRTAVHIVTLADLLAGGERTAEAFAHPAGGDERARGVAAQADAPKR